MAVERFVGTSLLIASHLRPSTAAAPPSEVRMAMKCERIVMDNISSHARAVFRKEISIQTAMAAL